MAGAVELLQELIRFDTSNPPGRERAAQHHLRDLLQAAGFACDLIGPDADRPNLVARLNGRADGPTLCLLGHIDTVPAAPEAWSIDPWSGTVRDGCVWGRGAVDMKSQIAAEVAAALALARAGWRPAAGHLLVVVTADEETGGRLGAQWLCHHVPEKVRCDMVINEGGGMALELGPRRVYGVAVAEKGVFRLTLATDGRDGHASVPGIGDNALVKLCRLVEALDAGQPALDQSPESAALLAALGYDGDPDDALRRLAAEHPRVAGVVEPGLRVTLAPTMIRASEKVNVIPGVAELAVDCRAAPGLDADDVRARLEAIIGRDSYRLRWDRALPGNRSPADTPLMDAIRAFVAREDPEAVVVPRLFPGFTDSHWFRETFDGCLAYGFFPQRAMTEPEALALLHAVDERIPVSDVELGERFFLEVVQAVLG